MIHWLTVRKVGAFFGFLAIIIFFSNGINDGQSMGTTIKDFLVNFSIEMFGISLTVIVIDWLHDKRDAQLKFEQLLREISSGYNNIALRAIAELRATGNLTNGRLRNAILFGASLDNARLDEANMERVNLSNASLRGANLGGCNLRGADLRNATLQDAYLEEADLANADLRQANLQNVVLRTAKLNGVNMWRANLQGSHLQDCVLEDAILEYVNLRGADNLSEAQLRIAHTLRGATMSSGERYDGRFKLPGDIQNAQERGIDVKDDKAMAAYYGVSVADYQIAQRFILLDDS